MNFLNENTHNIILAAAILMILIILLAVWRNFSPRVAGGRRGQRLGISEYYNVDRDRRLVLVRRDNVEHLILIGGPQDLVIEGGIGPFHTPSNQAGSGNSPPLPAATAVGTAKLAPRPPAFVEKVQPRRGEREL
ncbi:MAG: flagellar biosynthetic protein FliO [Aestuariivirga sp.]|uniref:flagellar biosynthetic protein FliO n=1 Tax=Aestuariivirga sp. TaxID=2650926 RepID=UPI0025C36CE3|nr:flagellar biosynthetic protein FliO [Aestuariivirga sp.]MCA3560486.1 flagellar biosynthetic protein FliO [Aestuariivirga sp.]